MNHELVYLIARAFWTQYGSPEAFRPEKTDSLNVLWFKACAAVSAAGS